MLKRLIAMILIGWMFVSGVDARSYSSSNRSSSSHSSSSRSSSSHSSSSSGRSYGSGSRSSYTSSASKSSSYSPSKTYGTSARSYTSSGSGSGRTYSAGSSSSPSSYSFSPTRKPAASFSFDSSAARSAREAASQRDFQKSRDISGARSSSSDRSALPSSHPPTARPYADSYRYPVIITPQVYQTRVVRYQRYYTPYRSRPVIVYNDPYDSFFWYWLLDQSLETRAMWAYHHRHDMDAARYQALLATDGALAGRVSELEAAQRSRNPAFIPSGMDADLMYNDQYVNNVYASRPTDMGRIMFWFFMALLVIGTGWFLSWFIFVKRW
ncbi:MAG: hypothetical protein HY360_06500 [Verrucomicrobia bacterium]|nr:hypothetical protein [Verrucomicrobiota bacterium]